MLINFVLGPDNDPLVLENSDYDNFETFCSLFTKDYNSSDENFKNSKLWDKSTSPLKKPHFESDERISIKIGYNNLLNSNIETEPTSNSISTKCETFKNFKFECPISTLIWTKNSDDAKYLKRKDITNKSCLRVIRHALWDLLIKHNNPSSFGSQKHSQAYMDSIVSLYNSILKSKIESFSDFNCEMESKICFILSIMTTGNFYFPKPTPAQKRMINMYRQLMRSYTAKNFYKLWSLAETRMLIKCLKEVGLISAGILKYKIDSISIENNNECIERMVSFAP